MSDSAVLPTTDSPNAVGEERAWRALDRLLKPRLDWLLLAALLLWFIYLANGFRTGPIALSDENAGSAIRQLLFSAAGALAGARLFFTQTIGAMIVTHWRGVAIGALILGSALWSTDPVLTIKRGLIYVFGFLLIATFTHSCRRPVYVMLVTVVGFTTVIAIVSLAIYFGLPKIYSVNPARPGLAGVSNHPNSISPFFSIGLILSLGIQTRRSGARFALWMSRGLLSIALMLTVSITTIVTTAFGFGLWVFLISTRYQRGLLKMGAVLGFSLVMLIGVDTLKSSFFSATGRDESLSGRDVLWERVWWEAQKNPMLGNGYGAFWTEGKGRLLVQTWNPRQSHNAFLDLFVDLGAIGLILVILLLPCQLLLQWPQKQGTPFSPQRHAVSALLACSFAYFLTYSLAQSYFLRFDSFPFFILFWSVVLMVNPAPNRIENEFAESRRLCV